MAYRLWNTTKDYREMVDTETGAVKRIMLASDKQFEYLNVLRADAGKKPLKNKPTVYEAKKAIDLLLEKLKQTKLL